MPVLKLHQSNLAALKCPSGKRRIEYCDSDVPGLYLLVGESETKTFFWRHKDISGKTCHRKIGRITEVTLAEARGQIKLWREEHLLSAKGVASTAARPKGEMTLADFWVDYYLPLAKQKKRSWKRDEQLWRLRIGPKFGSLKLTQIERHEVQLFHGNLLKEKLSPASCDLHAALLKRMLSMCVEYSFLDKNPASRMKLFHADNRIEHFLDDTQLGRLLEVLRTDKCRSVCLIAQFALATSCRLGEALSATWGQLDMENAVWRIPASNTKSQRSRSVPLNQSAMEVLEQLDTKGKYAHLFINSRTQKPFVNITRVWYKLRDKAGLPFLRFHDLRHTGASLYLASGASLFIVQTLLGHSNPSVTQRYAHLSMQTLHDASANASAIISRAKVSGAAVAKAAISVV